MKLDSVCAFLASRSHRAFFLRSASVLRSALSFASPLYCEGAICPSSVRIAVAEFGGLGRKPAARVNSALVGWSAELHAALR